jgi:hypothetical protein
MLGETSVTLCPRFCSSVAKRKGGRVDPNVVRRGSVTKVMFMYQTPVGAFR